MLGHLIIIRNSLLDRNSSLRVRLKGQPDVPETESREGVSFKGEVLGLPSLKWWSNLAIGV